MTLIEAIILGIVEGITEFLPISSTGHMIIASSLMGIADDSFTKTFTVSIQFGAILSVVVLYWKRFFQSMDFYYKLFVAFLPAVIFGKLLNDYIDALLGNVAVVAYSLLGGGIFLIFMDHFIKEKKDMTDDEISYKTALKIGLFQVIAMIPGVSRSAATIVGGLTQGLSRKTAAEFSFFLAVPTMFAATVYKLYEFYKSGVVVQQEQINLLIVGNVVAFIVAILAIRSFIGVVTKYGLKAYGYYRVIVGIIIIVLLINGVDLKIVD
ncbi:MAG: undecaprenyl-diphosphate phosphatase [Bacteroidota bacterium]|nr:undecaprenyl-diphosphate phosphatase [Bacteroidota bacterium]